MKKIIVLSIGIVIYLDCNFQTTQEWAQQKSTQKKCLLQQITAMHPGYLIISKDYTII